MDTVGAVGLAVNGVHPLAVLLGDGEVRFLLLDLLQNSELVLGVVVGGGFLSVINGFHNGLQELGHGDGQQGNDLVIVLVAIQGIGCLKVFLSGLQVLVIGKISGHGKNLLVFT